MGDQREHQAFHRLGSGVLGKYRLMDSRLCLFGCASASEHQIHLIIMTRRSTPLEEAPLAGVAEAGAGTAVLD